MKPRLKNLPRFKSAPRIRFLRIGADGAESAKIAAPAKKRARFRPAPPLAT